MDTRPALSLADQFNAACDWWREAGVDQDFSDDIVAMLGEAEETPKPAQQAQKRKPKPAETAKPKIGGDPAGWPQTLEVFQQWWLQEQSLDEAGTNGRVLPRGSANADLMVIVTIPELDDRDTLLSGNQGKLIGNMLRAMNIPQDKAYLASALPRHTPMADWAGLKTAGMGDILLHHIKLVSPKNVLILGRDILSLIGLEPRQGVTELPVDSAAIQASSKKKGSSKIQALASYSPEAMLQNARLRSDLWRRWLDWTGKQP